LPKEGWTAPLHEFDFGSPEANAAGKKAITPDASAGDAKATWQALAKANARIL
jgi:hypothetical protein